MKSGLNYGLLFLAGTMVLLWITVETALWLSRRSERGAGSHTEDMQERLDRAEAALREASEEIASVRAELTAHR